MPKLNQVIAIEKGVKSRVYAEVGKLDKAAQKPDLFNGFAKTYRKVDDLSESYPPESKRVVFQADTVLRQVAELTTELFDIVATKDYANQNAHADITVGDTTIAADVPVTYLLFLEKQLTDLHTMIARFPVLDEADDWTKDEASGLYKTPTVATHRTKKKQVPIVMYDATKEHPAQTQLLTEDVLVGYWDTVKLSGSLPAPRKALILDRIEVLLKAVKYAREEANGISAPEKEIGAVIFAHLFA